MCSNTLEMNKRLRISTQEGLEDAALRYGILPFFRNNIPGFSVEEMTAPGMLFGGNEYEGCWEWKGPVVRNRTTAYGKFFRKKAGFVSRELLPYFLKWRRSLHNVAPGSMDEMIFDIISINDKMTSTDLREAIIGKPKRRTAFDLPSLDMNPDVFTESDMERKPSRHTLEGPLQRLQMGGRICISDFRYKQTRKGERYGWGVAEYSTPEMLFDLHDLDALPSPEECLEYIISVTASRFKAATPDRLRKLLRP